MLAGVEAVDDRIDDARSAIDDIQRRMEAFFDDLASGNLAGSSSVTQPVSTLFMWIPSP